MTSTYQSYLSLTQNQTRTFARFENDPVRKRDETYYRENIGKIRNVDEFIKDSRLFNYAVSAFGLEDMKYAKALLKKVLTSDLSDTKSLANKLTDTRYKTFAAGFRFDTNGVVKNAPVVQSESQHEDTIARYQTATDGQILAGIEMFYLSQTLPTIDSVDALLNNSRALNDVLTAYGVSPDVPLTTIRSALTSDISDPASFVNRQGNQGLIELVADFNFDSTGSLTTERLVQTADSFTSMSKLYEQKIAFDATLDASKDTETEYVKTVLLSARYVDDVVKDARAVTYIGTAFGDRNIDSDTLRSVLVSDLLDPKSTANTMGPQYRKIAAFFQFTTTGSISRDTPYTAQSRTGVENAILSYVENDIESQAGLDGSGTQLALYFARMAPTITSPYEILADKALWKFAQTTLQLPASVGDNIDRIADTIESRFNMADLRDPKKVNGLISRFSAMYDLQSGTQAQDPILQLFNVS